MIQQIVWLILLSLPVACVSWTVTREEILREPREWLAECSRTSRHGWQRKVCYMLVCEYCFSHYVAAGVVAIMDYQLLVSGWRGYFLAWLSVVAVANVFMSAYSRLRVEIRKDRAEADRAESDTK